MVPPRSATSTRIASPLRTSSCVFCTAIGAGEVRALARQLHEQALLGDGAAAHLVLAYLVGQSAAGDLDTLDLTDRRSRDSLARPRPPPAGAAAARLPPGNGFS